MRRFFISLLFLVTVLKSEIFANWQKVFNVSDKIYKLYVVSDDFFNVTSGYYLTSFPCEGESKREFYKTTINNNLITLYCFKQPTEVFLSYITRSVNDYVAPNQKTDGYLKCPVEVINDGFGGLVPRLKVNISKCEKYQLSNN